MTTTLSHESVTITQAQETLEQAVKLYFSTDDLGNYRVSRRRARPICLMGPAGIGKTEIVHQVAQRLDLALCCYSIPHHTRQSLLGLPKLETQMIDGQEVSCTRYTMSELIDQVHRTMAQTGKNHGILFLDEVNCANESIRPVMLQLLQDKAFGTHPIPDGWMLVLAGNPAKYNRAAKDFDMVTLDRLRMIHVEPDLDTWMPYAQNQGVHPAILSFLSQNPQHFFHYDSDGTLVTPRGWEDLSIQLNLMEEEGMAPDLGFLSQFFQAPDVIRAMLQHYQQYSDLVESGLIDQICGKSPLALSAIQSMDLGQRWDLVSALLSRIHAQASRAVAFDRSVAQVHKTLSAQKILLRKGGAPALALLRKAAMDCDNRLARTFLEGCPKLLNQEQGWEAVKSAFDVELRQPQQTAFTQVTRLVENVVAVCNRALDDAPSVERLFNGLCDHRATAQILSTQETPHFQALFHSVHSDVQSELDGLAQRLGA